jgi:hypothetical protein
MQAMVATIF